MNRLLKATILALVLTTPAAEAQNFDAGAQAYNSGDYGAALREWVPLATRGDAEAQVNLGVMYDFGEGVSEDDAEAVAEIAAGLGINAQALIARARREGWKLRGGSTRRAIGTRETIARLKGLLQKRLSELEGQIGELGREADAASIERESGGFGEGGG